MTSYDMDAVESVKSENKVGKTSRQKADSKLETE